MTQLMLYRGSRYPPDTAGSLDDDEDRRVRAIFHAVFDLIDPLPITKAAQQIDALYPLYDEPRLARLEANGETYSHPESTVFWIMSDFVAPLALQIPHGHPGQDRLIDLLLALESLPPKPIWARPEGGQQVWHLNCGWLGNVLHYEYDGEIFSRKHEDPTESLLLQEARNFNSWTALLHARGVLDCSLFALWTLRGALESDLKAGPALEYRVPRAADWILRVGAAGVKFNVGKDQAILNDGLWQGVAGFSRERWRFWKSRFFDIGHMDRLTCETRTISLAAAEKIDWAEGDA